MRKLGLRPVLVGILAIGLISGGCGDDDGDETAASTTTSLDSEPSSDAEGGSQEIVIKTHLDLPDGEVLDGSSIGDAPFCPGGTFSDKHGNPEIGSVDRAMECPDGTLRFGFSPGEPTDPAGLTQTGPWTIVSGTGAYEEWRGHGRMEATFESDSGTEGAETFTGTVVVP